MYKEQTGNSNQSVKLSSWGWSQQGDRKEENQDAYLNWPERKFWCVADGLGGTDFGGSASKYIIRSFMQLQNASSLDGFIQTVKTIIDDDNDLLFTQGRVGGSAASTVVSLLMHEGEAVCLWAGDSRCYLLRNDVLYQCTHDHTLRQNKIDSGELTVAEAHRMVRGNIITNAIGVKQNTHLDEVRFGLRAGDKFLLCSDGLSHVLTAESITRLMGKAHPKACVDAMVAAIKDKPQPDNITFIVVHLSHKA